MQRTPYEAPSITEIGKIATYTLGSGGSCKDGGYKDKDGRVVCTSSKHSKSYNKSYKSYKAPKRKKW